MIQSKKQTDQRLIDMIRFKYARREGVKIGFGTFNFSGDEKIENDSENAESIISKDVRKEEFSQQNDRS